MGRPAKSRSAEQRSGVIASVLVNYGPRLKRRHLFGVVSALLCAPGAFEAMANSPVISCVSTVARDTINFQVYELHATAPERLLLSTRQGLYAVEIDTNGEKAKLIVGTEGKITVQTIFHDGQIFAASTEGLYQVARDWSGAALVTGSENLGIVRALHSLGGALLIGSDRGIFELVGGELRGTAVSQLTNVFIQTADGVYAGGETAVFRRQPTGGWDTIADGLRRAYSMHAGFPDERTIVVGTERNAFVINTRSIDRPYEIVTFTPPLGQVQTITATSAGLLLGTRTGVFLLSGRSHQLPSPVQLRSERLRGGTLQPAAAETRLVYQIQRLDEAGASLLVAADEGLFWRQRNGPLRLVAGSSSGDQGSVLSIATVGSRTFAGTLRGVVELHTVAAESVRMAPVGSSTLVSQRPAEAIQIRLDLGACSEAAQDVPLSWSLVPSSGGAVAGLGRLRSVGGNTALFDITFDTQNLPASGTGVLRLYHPDIDGDVTMISYISVSFSRDWRKFAENLGKIAATLTIMGHFLYFAVLIALAPRYVTAFELLFDPRFGRLRLYFNFAIAHFGWLQKYIFSGVYRRVASKRALAATDRYAVVPLTSDSGQIPSDHLLTSLTERRRVALFGRAGRGKTAAVQCMARSFFAHRSIYEAVRHCGGFLVVVDHRFVQVPESDAVSWMLRSVRLALEECEASISDSQAIEDLIRAGFFVICLDGLNEAAREQDLLICATRFRRAAMLYTTKANVVAGFSRLALPASLAPYSEEILAAHFGVERAKAALSHIDAGSLSDLQSGYEIWLLGSMQVSEGYVLPGRLELYDLAITHARELGFSDSMDRLLSRCAFLSWLEGNENLVDRLKIPKADIDILVQANFLCWRGASYIEFSHTQMRGFFASRWLAHHLGTVSQVFRALDSSNIWSLPPASQAEMFVYFAEMAIDSLRPAKFGTSYFNEEGGDVTQQLAQWAVADGERFVLQRELVRAARRAGITLDVKLGAAG